MSEATELIARVCHEANRAYCEAIGDHSQLPWHDAPKWQRDSAISGVVAIVDGTVTSPRQSHEQWSREKTAAGWQFGMVKDAESKTHPCLVDYDDLPREQRAKDYLFQGIVKALADVK